MRHQGKLWVRRGPGVGRGLLIRDLTLVPSGSYTSTGKLLAVAHLYTATGPASARVRIISAREATRQERRQYEEG